MGMFDTAAPAVASIYTLLAGRFSIIPEILPKDHVEDSDTSADVTISTTVALLGTLGGRFYCGMGGKDGGKRDDKTLSPYFKGNTPPMDMAYFSRNSSRVWRII